MEAILTTSSIAMADSNQQIGDTFKSERARLQNFIRQRVPNPTDAEDILNDVFVEFVEAYRLPEPIEQIGAWLFRVARNRIVDRFRKKKEEPLPLTADDEDDAHWLENALPSNTGPEAAYARAVLLEELTNALEELPIAQRQAFMENEIEGKSFKTIAAETGVPINTLLARKRYAVQHLRSRLQAIYDDVLMTEER